MGKCRGAPGGGLLAGWIIVKERKVLIEEERLSDRTTLPSRFDQQQHLSEKKFACHERFENNAA